MSERSARPSKRIEGYDLARALAIIGMVFVNFRVTLELSGANLEGEGIGGWLSQWITGRAAATFVVLAGVGIALLTGRAMQDANEIPRARRRLLYRAFFLAAIGWPFFTVWDGDILHYYAGFFLAGAFVFPWRTRNHLVAAIIISFLFLAVLPVWSRNWDFSSLTYQNLWTVKGQLMNFFLNGFHPLIPWLAFLMIGLALGRTLQRQPEAVLMIGLLAFGVSIMAEVATSAAIRSFTVARQPTAEELIEIRNLLGTSAFPPMPQYILAAGSFAVALICACRWIGGKLSGHWILRPFVCLGQMALTVYIIHVFAGVFPLYVSGEEMAESWSLGECLLATTAFCVVALIGATAWRHWFRQGPAEWLMRRFSDYQDNRRWLALIAAAGAMGLLVAVTSD